jgi:uncharacterized membrane protein YraQ (UPF0718 family)
MIKQLKKFWLLAAVLIIDSGLGVYDSALAGASLHNSFQFLTEVLMIVPPVMVLMGLFDVWVPRKLVEQNIGQGTGLRGMLFTILLGTAAAGPIYAAFPVALSLYKKGARIANIGIFLGTWATIKIPMILMESTFIGLRFALIRLSLTIPGVIGVGLLMERLIPEDTVPDSQSGPNIAL